MVEENKKKIVDEFKYLQDDEEDEFYDTEENEENEVDLQDEYEKVIIQTANTIQNNIFEYVSAYGLPLCENLSIDRIIKFINTSNS